MKQPLPVTRDDAVAAMRTYFERPEWEPRYVDEEGATALMQRVLEEDRQRVIERQQETKTT